MPRRGLGLVAAVVCLVAALAGVANGFRLEQGAFDDRDAIAEGVTTPARVLGSLTSKQRQTRVRLVVEDVERRASAFPDRAYIAGPVVDVAYRPSDPGRIYIVGAAPWNW